MTHARHREQRSPEPSTQAGGSPRCRCGLLYGRDLTIGGLRRADRRWAVRRRDDRNRACPPLADRSVADLDDPILPALSDARVMGYDNHGDVIATMDLVQQVEDLCGVSLIQVARRLVGEEERWKR